MGFLLIFSAGRHEPEPVISRAVGEDAVKEEIFSAALQTAGLEKPCHRFMPEAVAFDIRRR